MKGIPVIPMIRILQQYAAVNGFPLKITNWQSIMEIFEIYNLDAQFKN